MRGSMFERKRGSGSWTFVVDLGYALNAETGRRKRRQRWSTFRGTKREAEKALNDLVGKVHRGEHVSPSRLSVAEWLDTWLDLVKPKLRENTYESYCTALRKHLKPALGAIRLQQLTALDIEAYHASKAAAFAPATLAVHHSILSSALKAAKKRHLVPSNVAPDVEGRPQAPDPAAAADVLEKCWTEAEVRDVLAAASEAGTQLSALLAVLLDTGARRGEALALRWQDVDLDAGTVTISHQFKRQPLKDGVLQFGPLKRGGPRVVGLHAETVDRLRAHKKAQAALNLANRTRYQDLALVFAREWLDLRADNTLGGPLPTSTMDLQFKRVVKAAGVRAMNLHGTRHTSITLLLRAGVPLHVVAKRVGHKDGNETLARYAHAVQGDQAGAAAAIGRALYGI